MGKLIYSMITSLDGFVSDTEGNFDWGVPAEDAHQFINDRYRSVGTYLYGRRMYEVMSYWETALAQPDPPEFYSDFARVWQAADKIVVSTTLEEVVSERTRIERSFDPEAIRAMKAASDQDLSINGPTLAAQAIKAGLVDVYELFLVPVVVGGGNSFYPDGVRLDLELLEEQRFSDGMVFLRYGLA